LSRHAGTKILRVLDQQGKFVYVDVEQVTVVADRSSVTFPQTDPD
jgi:hypothetical protein